MQKFKTVTEFLESLPTDKRAQVEALRSIILSTAPSLDEHIKWNAPSYMVDDEDRITFNLLNAQSLVKLVLHMGATVKENKKGAPILKDSSNLIEWSSDIRGILSFQSLADINSKQDEIARTVKDWIAIQP